MALQTEPAVSNESGHPYAGLENADTNYATWFDPRDVEQTEEFESDSDWRRTRKRLYWKHQDAQHRGYQNGKKRGNKRFQTYQSNQHLSRAFSNVLELTESEKIEAERWFRWLNFDKIGQDLRVVGFAVCMYIVECDERDERRGDPNSKHEWPPEFLRYYETLPAELKRRFPKVYGKVSYRIRSWSIGEDEPASENMDKYEMYDAQFWRK
ncbi:hypothetical protein [Halobellus rubicundus]|uniref:Uncharacterized protein n=1 Tax=Halobellus rubicundus TaxID=2996466 RepID=A0ABD5MDN9_9EURY